MKRAAAGEDRPEPAKRNMGGLGAVRLSSSGGDLESVKANVRNLGKLLEQDPSNKELLELRESVEKQIEELSGTSCVIETATTELFEGHNAVEAPARRIGRVVMFNVKKGFGFIRPDLLGDEGQGVSSGEHGSEKQDVFVHRKSVVMAEGSSGTGVPLNENQQVSFLLEVSEGRTMALDVRDPDGQPLVAHDTAGLTHLDIRAHTESWRGLKDQQEDRYVTGEDLGDLGIYYAIFDGHGGIFSPEFLAKYLHKNLLARRGTNAAWSGSEACARKLLIDSFNGTDKDMLSQPGYKKVKDGSTALVALVQGTSPPSPESRGDARIYIANTGDCRGVLCRGGRAVRMSEDHKPNRNDEMRRIKDAGGAVVNMGGIARVTTAAGAGAGVNLKEHQYLAVSRSFGDADLKMPKKIVTCEPEVKAFDVTEEDLFFVLACDGVWDHLTDQEVVNIAGEYFGRPQDGAASVVRTAYQHGSGDNLTATVVEFGWVDADRVKDNLKSVANEVMPEEDLDMFGD